MHAFNNLAQNKFTRELLTFYSEQLDSKAHWFILDTQTNKIVLHNNSFIELFQCDCDNRHLNLHELPITKKSYIDLLNEINYTINSNNFSTYMITLELQCNKLIPLWITLQPIIVNDTQVAIIVNLQQADKTINYINKLIIDKFKHIINNNEMLKNEHDINNSTSLDTIIDKQQSKYNFSHNERKILKLVLAGFSQKDICQTLDISRTRVTQYISQLCQKCGYKGYSGKYLKKFFVNNNIVASI